MMVPAVAIYPFQLMLLAFFFATSKVTKEAEIPQEGFSLIFAV